MAVGRKSPDAMSVRLPDGINSYHFAGPRRWELVPDSCGVLEHIQSTCGIESKAENSSEITAENTYLAGWRDLEHLGGARNNRERIKVSDIKVAIVVGDRRRHDVALAGRNINDAGHPNPGVILSSSP
jgi:hypothetical protein